MRDIPVTLLGGYLGSGKTTLVNSLLRQAGAVEDGPRIAVLVNDFGQLPIDADLIEADEGDLISLAGGCVCCSYGDDLSLAIEQIRAMEPRPDHVLLETSGVALPGAIAASLSLQAGVQVDAVVVLADADAIRARHRNEFLSDTVERQLADASLVVITKSDLVEEDRLADLPEWLAALAPHAAVVSSVDQSVPLDIVLGLAQAPELPVVHGHDHDHGHDHGHDHDNDYLHDHTHHDAGDLYRTHTFHPADLFDVEGLAHGLAGMDGVLRAKGFVAGSDGAVYTLQVVGKRADISPAPEGVAAGLVVIGLAGGLERERLDSLVDQARVAAQKMAG